VAPIDPLRFGLLGSAARPAPGRRKAERRGAGAGVEPGSDSDQPAAPRLPAHILPLADEVEQAGAELGRDATGATLERYRKAVRRFLDAALRDSQRVTAETTLGLAQRVFASITRSDVLLADLADAVLGRQRDAQQVHRLIGQLKGLLIDLYR
jgi:uncharacterized protein YaaR (DUF327 family)